MAPSNLVVKSESWLDLSTRSELIEACKRNRAPAHQLVRGASVEPSTLNGASGVGSGAHRLSSVTSTSSLITNNKKGHLLIRLRQQSYLARSNSTTLSTSSNLSASVDLDWPLCTRGGDYCSADATIREKEEESRPAGCKRELSFGLKSFRERFEQRARAQKRRPGNASPFARSLSSLSQHLESRLSHIGHSWKSFLYKYRQERHGETNDESLHFRDATKREEEEFNSGAHRNEAPQATSAAAAADNQSNLFSVKRRLTSDWVARHCSRMAEEEEDSRRNNYNSRERPNSLIVQRRRSGDQERNHELTTRARTSRSQSIELRARSELESTRRLGDITTTSSSSSTTLVSENKKKGASAAAAASKKKKKLERQHQTTRSRQGHDDNSSPETDTNSLSSSSTQSAMSGLSGAQKEKLQIIESGKRQQQQQHQLVATSDYWSGGATTATASEFELLSGGGSHIQMAPPVGVSPTPQLDAANFSADADYYFDVASASSMLPQVADADARGNGAPLNQQQQHMLFAANNIQLQQEQATAAAGLMFEPGEGDYDDYAVPSDENGCRLDRSQVELVRLIGEGQKGFVFLGKLQSRDGSQLMDVAIKTLKYETEQLIERLMSEAATMKQLEHPHIIKFIGMCPETPALIAMELAQFGEIKHYLKINRHLIKCSQLVLFSFQISTALSYLESKNYVHRDVAARNVLVCSHNCVKLADFGLSRNLQSLSSQLDAMAAGGAPASQQRATQLAESQSLYVAAPRVKLPVRWLAPESLVFRRFTSASDVWMFAVCAWELFHFGAVRPWPELRNQQVLLAIESGRRPAQPAACPERLYALMLKCWSYAPIQRPKFREIKQCIWSIYLNERTREQLELERLEQVRQKYMQMARQQQAAQVSQQHVNQVLLAQQQQQQQVMAAQQQQKLLMTYSTPSNYSSGATTDNEQSTSPCSSAFNSMGRRGTHAVASGRPLNQQQRQASQARLQNQALQLQLSRFKQRQTTAAQQQQQSHSPVNFRQPHVLQKQRSQGAIGMASVHQREENELDGRYLAWPPGVTGKCCQHATSGKTPLRARDDHALELAKRRACNSAHLERQQHAYIEESDIDDDDDEEDDAQDYNETGSQDADSAIVGSPTGAFGQLSRRHDVTTSSQRVPPLVGGRVMSASPALTADARSQSRMVSVEPAYEGVAAANAASQRSASRASGGGGQVAMLRANFDLSSRGSPLGTSPVLTSATTPSPARTSTVSPTQPPTRPTSWRNSRAGDTSQLTTDNQITSTHNNPSSRLFLGAHQQQQQQQSKQQVAAAAAAAKRHAASQRAPDQLGQVLQALRLTPMKAKLKQPTEQSVRVLQREESKSPQLRVADGGQPTATKTAAASRHTHGKDNGGEQKMDDSADQRRQLMLHERLLGRIRPSSIVLATNEQGRACTPVTSQQGGGGASRAQRPQLAYQNKSVEAVDHSLQILESLMGATSSGPPPGGELRQQHGNNRVAALSSSSQLQGQHASWQQSTSLPRKRGRG